MSFSYKHLFKSYINKCETIHAKSEHLRGKISNVHVPFHLIPASIDTILI